MATAELDATAAKAAPSPWHCSLPVIQRTAIAVSAESDHADALVAMPWLNRSVAVVDTAPGKNAVSALMANVSPADLVMPRTVARAVPAGQKDSAQPDP